MKELLWSHQSDIYTHETIRGEILNLSVIIAPFAWLLNPIDHFSEFIIEELAIISIRENKDMLGCLFFFYSLDTLRAFGPRVWNS